MKEKGKRGDWGKNRLIPALLRSDCFHLCMMYSYTCNVLPLHCVAHRFHKRGVPPASMAGRWLSLCLSIKA